ncbi:MAG: AIR synthase-related protein [Lentisphaeria bacterium]|nr:AIR synthase-related protein [Lentisphaeria bacterium]
MYYRLEVSPKLNVGDPRGDGALHQIRSYLDLPVDHIFTRDVYSVYADISRDDAEKAVAAITNPVIQTGAVGETAPDIDFDWQVVVGFGPGVTDNVARSTRKLLADVLERPLDPSEEVYTSVEYFIKAPDFDRETVKHLAFDVLANDLIQTVHLASRQEWKAAGTPENRPAFADDSKPHVDVIDLQVADHDLIRISKEGTLALTLEEMKAIQTYFLSQKEVREHMGLSINPTDVELEVLAQTWSEHCKHKIFNARIEYRDGDGDVEIIDSCFKSYIRKSTEEIGETIDWLVSIFHDNAGVIRFNDELDVVYKVETHNSPTALDPYGGAMTGIVGVNRDPMGTGMGANLVLNVWGYCFGSPFTAAADVPEGLFHPRRLRDQVHKGVIDGGNQSGIPYAAGWEYFDPRYLGKPLVYCGTLGTLPKELNGKSGAEKSIEPGDFAVMIGGRIGKDGIHGATFSSEELHKDSPVQAVQIGDPITQKLVSDFLMEARDKLLYRFITDNGAGGLSSSLGEMSELCGGCEIDLANAPLKYAGLQPWEIFVSEAQERMSLAVPPESLDAFLAFAKRRNVEATVLGRFTDSGYLHVTYNGQTVAWLKEHFLHDGLPQLTIPAEWRAPVWPEPEVGVDRDVKADLLSLLGRLNICSGEFKARQYDHEVKGLSVLKPYTGVHRNVAADATVSMIKPLGTDGVIMAYGIAPRYSDIDTYDMMASVIDMAIRRTIAVGGKLDRVAGLDNFCWPDPVVSPANPDGKYKAAQLVRANRALYDYTKAFGVPCVSGKDSMKNDSTKGGKRISIPPTVLFSTLAVMEDITKAVSLDVKCPGDLVYVIGNTRAELGGSEFFAMLGAVGNHVPKVDAAAAKDLYRRVSQLTELELCHSLSTPALGGLGVALAKMAVAGDLGMEIDVSAIPAAAGLTPADVLFSESNSRFIATVAPEDKAAFEDRLEGTPFACVGRVTAEPALTLKTVSRTITLSVDELTCAYTTTLDGV